MDLTAKAKYTMEVTSDELFVIVNGLSKLCGEPGRNRNDEAYKLLDKLQTMVGLIERTEKAVEEAVIQKDESAGNRSAPMLPPIPPVPGPAMPSGDDSQVSEPPRGGEGGPRPPAPPTITGRPLNLPPSILPPGPPPQPPKKSSTKKAKKKKAKS